MALSLLPQIGAIAGWKLELRPVLTGTTTGVPVAVPGKTHSFSSDDYRGSIDATMVSGLNAGSYTIVVEDVSDRDFQTLSVLASGDDPLEARIFMYWTDAPRPTAGGADGLVAVLRVTSLRRRPGKWRYEMVVDGREWVYDRMTLLCPPAPGDGALGAAASLARAMLVELDPVPVVPPGTEKRDSDPTLSGIDQMRQYEAAMVAEAASAGQPRAGLGMYLIRDGKLRIGSDRIRVPPTMPTLDVDSGLLTIERNGAVREDESPVGVDEGNPPHRDLFVATLRGRPDLKPGDVVEFSSPEQSGLAEDVGFALGPARQTLAGETVTAYVQEVSHRLNREQGFFTVVHCVAAASGAGDTVERLWFDGAAPDNAGDGGSGGSIITRMLDRARDAARPDRWPDVAQVRANNLGATSPPHLSEKLWRGLVDPDGKLYSAGRQPFGKVRKELAEAPYLTPFAYGAWGLVLPRYPGMRVLVVNRGGDPDDPVDVGALWSRGSGPAALMGDWWLCLPVDVDGGDTPRSSVADTETAEPAQSGNAANDLIDAAGTRVIEVGKLTIRIGKSQLQPPSVRPVALDDPVRIDYNDSTASITIEQDGSIRIVSTKTITLKGKDGISLESEGDVTIKASGKVDVQKKV